MLEVSTENGAYANGLAEAGHARLDAADTAHPDIDRHAGLAGPVKSIDDRLVDDGVQLDRDAGGQAGLGVRRLLCDALEQTLAQVQGSDQKAFELLLDGVARELVEESGEVFAHLVVGGEEAEIFVD